MTICYYVIALKYIMSNLDMCAECEVLYFEALENNGFGRKGVGVGERVLSILCVYVRTCMYFTKSKVKREIAFLVQGLLHIHSTLLS